MVSRKKTIEKLLEISETLCGIGDALEWDGINEPHVQAVDGVIDELSELLGELEEAV